jgi:beta-lactam-binding protein with PASTA domain
VPNLLGKSEAGARVALSANGLLLGNIEYEVTTEIDPGMILLQSPLPGEEVSIASQVDITVTVTEEVEPSGQKAEEAPKEEQGGFKLWW